MTKQNSPSNRRKVQMAQNKIEVSGQQLYELKWFCKNVAGVRMDMYDTIELVNKFDDRIKRLEQTAANIDKWIERYESQKGQGDGAI